jgi:hypothetical protein
VKRGLDLVFGAKAQVVLGVACFLIGAAWWTYIALVGITVAAVFHVSMFFGLAACYAIVATGLGFRATERVEAHVADVEHADEVNVDRAQEQEA